jgi:hypothetical protein
MQFNRSIFKEYNIFLCLTRIRCVAEWERRSGTLRVVGSKNPAASFEFDLWIAEFDFDLRSSPSGQILES